MSYRTLAIWFLRVDGVLLLVLAAVHLVATAHIAGLLDGSPAAVYRFAIGPTLFNHVLVGVLLLPLGYTTWLAATGAERRELWSRRVLVVNTVTICALPLALIVFMRQPEYYAAPLFVLGVGLVIVISILMIAATLLLLRGKEPRDLDRSL